VKKWPELLRLFKNIIPQLVILTEESLYALGYNLLLAATIAVCHSPNVSVDRLEAVYLKPVAQPFSQFVCDSHFVSYIYIWLS
jgi:hypothetical protein